MNFLREHRVLLNGKYVISWYKAILGRCHEIWVFRVETIIVCDLESIKLQYLVKHNPAGTIGAALSKSISAAVQHNTLYTEWLSAVERKLVRETWSDHLIFLGDKYTTVQSNEAYELDILFLQSLMNEMHGQLFRQTPHPKFKYDPGFRISHSQKSISEYLKHLWCMGKIPEPPQCPVDALILAIAGSSPTEKRWSYVNSIEEHRKKVLILSRMANSQNLTLPAWELLQFGT